MVARTIMLAESDCLPEPAADALAGMLLDDSSYDRLIRDEDTDVLKPDGSPLLSFRRRAISARACRAAWSQLRLTHLYFPGENNRGMATGRAKDGGTRAFRLKKDGTLSQTQISRVAGTDPRSGIVGYFERNPRFPYCRQTAFNANHPELFAAALPLFREVDALFAATVPDRHAAQRAMCDRTPPEFVISGTVFTTVTVNLNWQTAVHKDAGDLKAGFGIMCAFRAGRYDGCYLCFPRFRTAVDLRTGDVLLADVHEWHGNTPFVGVPGGFERLSLVLYYREHMHRCLSPAEELELAKRRTSRAQLNG